MEKFKGKEESGTSTKLEKILWKLLEPTFNLKNGHYPNLLLNQWISKTETSASKTVRKLNDTFFKWIIAAVNTWNEKKITPSTPVLSFALNVGSQLSKDENFFTKMKNGKVYGILTDLTDKNRDFDTGVSVGLIALLSSVLEHMSGLQWLLTTTYWNDVVTTALKGQTNYIKQKGYHFIIKLLETTILHDKDFCEELVEMLIEPLNVAAVQVEFIKELEKHRKMYENLKPTLDLVSEVAEILLKKFDKKILNMFVETEIPEAIQNILNYSQIADFSFDLLKIRFTFLFYNLVGKLEKARKTTHDEDTLFDIGIMFDLIRAEIERDHVKCVIKICYFAHVLYYNLNTGVPLCVRKGQNIEFQNQMMLFQLVPVMALSQQFLGTHKSKQLSLTDDLRQHFYLKLAKISAIKTLEITFRWEQRLAVKIDLLETVTMSLQYIQKSKRIIDKEQAAIIFQPLIYLLKDTLSPLEKFQRRKMLPSEMNYLNVLVTTIIDLVETFDLTWKDSIETISVLDLACEIVQYEYIDYQVTVKFLQLLNVAISKCMSPNMVLLMISTDTVISQIGSTLYTKCHNGSYHVRTVALEVVRTVALNAKSKFPEFTNILFNAELPELVINMALKDKEHEVRKTAIICIHALLLVEDIWEAYQSNYKFWDVDQQPRTYLSIGLKSAGVRADVLESCRRSFHFKIESVHDDFINILINEPKGIVRSEAVILIYKIYDFPKKVLERLYDVMTHAAICDNYWEVRRKSLLFWGRSIEINLEYQGMTDRTFPEFIFSKEKRKIVNLTKQEIKKRVIEALNNLSNIGAMYVLKTALEDPDQQVLQYALRLTAGMVLLFRSFKLSIDEIDLDPPSSSSDSDSSQSHPVSPASSDQQSSPEGQFSSESSQSQYPDSPSFSNLLNPNPSSYPPTPEDASLSPSDYTFPPTPSTPSTQYTNMPSTFGTNTTEQNGNTGTGEKEMENTDFFEMGIKDNHYIPVLDSDIDLELMLTDNMVTPFGTDLAETGKLFEELLQLNEATLLEDILCNSRCQAQAQKIKTRQYIPPSEYVKLCLEVVETKEKSEQLAHKDEFDSLLNKISKEFNLDR